MGADLIAYSVVLPATGVKRSVGQEIKRINKAISKYGEAADEVLAKQTGIHLDSYENDMGDVFGREDLIAAILHDLSLLRDFTEVTYFRDLCSHRQVIGGKSVIFMYAGEMSWGDEPDGLGYQTLRALCRLGIASKFRKRLER